MASASLSVQQKDTIYDALYVVDEVAAVIELARFHAETKNYLAGIRSSHELESQHAGPEPTSLTDTALQNALFAASRRLKHARKEIASTLETLERTGVAS